MGRLGMGPAPRGRLIVLSEVQSRFMDVRPAVDSCTLRWQREASESIRLRKGVVEPVRRQINAGVMVTVRHGGGEGYAATTDLSREGIRRACDRAKRWAEATRGRNLVPHDPAPVRAGSYRGPCAIRWKDVSLADKIARLQAHAPTLDGADQIVDWMVDLSHIDVESVLIGDDGVAIDQRFEALVPGMIVVANEGAETQVRSLFGRGVARQGGLEVLDSIGFDDASTRLREEALALLHAPDCPEGDMDVVLAPDQMILQIHESIGHPLELDRILGDERNYAGTSFVTLDMFGSYRYGSELLNVTFDPGVEGQLASYAFDDEGTPAERTYIIRDGMLERPLGSASSQRRAQIDGVANARSCAWNRPPIDRMANLNLEPGTDSFESLIANVERGVYMETNCSWSIDDSRNKFQFGCELGRIIEDGELKGIVKKPNYRGISATFWRNLTGVGDPSTFQVLGTPNCGKGEPNQMVRVGHATPPCRFSNVSVFGGASS